MKQTMKFNILVVILIALLNACSIGGKLREDLKASSYDYDPPSKANWRKLGERAGSDIAFANPKSGATILINSTCFRYQDSSLKSLSKNLLSPLGKYEIIKQENREINKRKALWTHVKGEIDGVTVENILLVHRKNQCLFDFALLSPLAIQKADQLAFENLVNSFRYDRWIK